MGVKVKKEAGQIRLAQVGRDDPTPVRLIKTNGKRFTDEMTLYQEWMWVVEIMATGEQKEILEDDIKDVLTEMEAIAWASK